MPVPPMSKKRKKHKSDCECYSCRHGQAAARAAEKQNMKKYGFFVHAVADDFLDNTPTRFNVHTHGLPQTWGHADLQIVLPLEPTTCHSLLWAAVHLIKAGT